MVLNGQMQQVTIVQQMVTVFAPAQNLAFIQPGQPTQIMIEQQQVTVTVNGYTVQMMIQQMPITIVAQQPVIYHDVQVIVQPQQVTLINQGQPVVLVIIQHVVQIIVMLPGQLVVMQQVFGCSCPHTYCYDYIRKPIEVSRVLRFSIWLTHLIAQSVSAPSQCSLMLFADDVQRHQQDPGTVRPKYLCTAAWVWAAIRLWQLRRWPPWRETQEEAQQKGL